MKALLSSRAVALLAFGVVGCGGASGGSTAAHTATMVAQHDASKPASGNKVESLVAPVSGDTDGDSPEKSAFDSDDFHSMHFGHAADAREKAAIAALVERYYAALAAGDGARVCSLLLASVAESAFETYDRATIDASGSQESCAAVVAAVIASSRRGLLSEAHSIRVVGVRVRRRRASAILRFEGRSARHILLYREGNAWKIGTLADEDLG